MSKLKMKINQLTKRLKSYINPIVAFTLLLFFQSTHTIALPLVITIFQIIYFVIFPGWKNLYSGIWPNIKLTITFIILPFQFYELACIHPKIVNMPSFKNISKVLSEKHAQERTILIDNIYPKASLNVSHYLKGLPYWPILANLYAFYLNCFQQ